ncbi:MAG: extracellular solute-binding protein [Candidatus Dormibacteraeota bacterium]|nr:extracellular solute-binding protein [Candidatus Dormibacteraeota bacterium]
MAWLSRWASLFLLLALGVGCGGLATAPATSAAPGTVRIYTSVVQTTVDPVVSGFQAAHPGSKVQVFRAPTGEINARIAADRRAGQVKADILWGTDPLSSFQYDQQSLFADYKPKDAGAVPAAYHTGTLWGTRLLNVVIVYRSNQTAPSGWHDLASPEFKNAVALPDPGFAGGALAALGYLSQAPGFGIDYYRSLKNNGAVQLRAMGDVTTGVAEARYKAGMGLDNDIRTAIAKGSPLKLAWPVEGAITFYSPISIFRTAADASAASAFVDFVISRQGQQLIAGSGWQPVRADVKGPAPLGAQVSPDWTAIARRQSELIAAYRGVFPG